MMNDNSRNSLRGACRTRPAGTDETGQNFINGRMTMKMKRVQFSIEMSRPDFLNLWDKVATLTRLQITGANYTKYAINDDIVMLQAKSRCYSDTDFKGYTVIIDRSLAHLIPEKLEEIE